MNILDILSETFSSLLANKTRSALTILGIVVGIAAAIVMVSVGQGATKSIQDSIASAGSNLITVTNTAQTGDGLTSDDVSAVKQVSGVKAATPDVSTSATLVVGENSVTSNVTGVQGDYATIKNLTVTKGNFISDYDNKIVAHAVVVAPGLVTQLWSEGFDPVGQTVRIDGVVYTVVGLTKAKTTNDTSAYIPLATAQASLAGKGSYSSINIEAQSDSVMTVATNEVEQVLMAQHGITSTDDEDFTVVSSSSLLDMASSISSTMTLLLAAIASVSLVVGGIGIMNMMLTSVTERIREIGLRKAVGATPANITLQFLVEAIILTVVGGVVGVVVGWGIAAILDATGAVSTSVTLGAVGLAVGVCVLIGLVFGFYPARHASRLDPIDALRYQ